MGTRIGVYAVEMISDGLFGQMAALTPQGVAPVQLAGAVDQIRTVAPDGELVRVARALGTSFGDEA